MPTDCTFFWCLLKSRILKRRKKENVIFWQKIIVTSLLDRLCTHHVIFFTIYFPVDVVKGLSSESSSTRTTYKTVCMVQATHCLARLTCTSNLLVACYAQTWRKEKIVENDSLLEICSSNDNTFRIKLCSKFNRN